MRAKAVSRSPSTSVALTTTMWCSGRKLTVVGFSWPEVMTSVPVSATPDAAKLTPASSKPSDGSDAVTLSHAVAGVAETGTLVLASGPDNPTTLNFLPEHHIVVLEAKDVVGDYESVWDALRKKVGAKMPRTVNWITGASRSADIEQVLLNGAHGPKGLHVIIVGKP